MFRNTNKRLNRQDSLLDHQKSLNTQQRTTALQFRLSCQRILSEFIATGKQSIPHHQTLATTSTGRDGWHAVTAGIAMRHFEPIVWLAGRPVQFVLSTEKRVSSPNSRWPANQTAGATRAHKTVLLAAGTVKPLTKPGPADIITPNEVSLVTD